MSLSYRARTTNGPFSTQTCVGRAFAFKKSICMGRLPEQWKTSAEDASNVVAGPKDAIPVVVIAGVPSPSWTSFVLADSQDEVGELLEGNNYGEFQVTP